MLLHGQYTIDEYLNSGGFGITYRAKDSLGRPIVIKECFPSIMCLRKGTKVAARSSEYKEELAGMIAGFVAEAHHLAALTHKNIVHVHQVFEENDTAYMAIDYIEGMDLLERIDLETERLTPKEIVRLTKRILPAVRYMHGMGMLHRDIAPDNILIDQNGEPVLIDFGAARKNAPTSRRAISKMKFVKDGYSPQEFYIAGADQGPWSDIYSLAASLYHAISGEAPEDGQRRMSALAQKQPDPYVPLAKRIRGYPPQFLETIDAALKVNPRDRIQSAEDWMRRMSNRPTKSQTSGKKIDLPQSAPASINKKHLEKEGMLPDLNEASIRKEILSSKKKPKAGISAGLIGGIAVALLAGAGAIAYVMTPSNPSAPVLTAQSPPESLPVQADVAPAPTNAPTEPVEIPTPSLPVEGIIASDTAAQNANLERAEALASLKLPEAAQIGPPPRPVDLIPVITPPTIILPAVSEVGFSFTAAIGEANSVAMSLDTTPQTVNSVSGPEITTSETAPSVDVTPPAAFVPPRATGSILASQIVGSHWDVTMPFTSELLQVRNSHTIQIAELSDTADLSISGTWIKEGTTIYSFNGAPLPAGTPLSVSLLNTMNIDPDGYIRGTVRFKDPDTGSIDRGLLAVPAFRQITFADGTVLEARVLDLRWQISVTEPSPRANGLEVDDILLGEKTTGIGFVTHDNLSAAMDRLGSNGVENALMEVRRGSETLDISVPLSRASN